MSGFLLARTLTVAAAAVIAGAGFMTALPDRGEAAPVLCPEPSPKTVMTLDTAPGATCFLTGDGNINGNNDAINQAGYITLDKTDGASKVPGAVITTTGDKSGTFSLTLPVGYSDFVIAFKTGQGKNSPSWFSFLLPAGVTSGNWTIANPTNPTNGLSHANLYGKISAVPLPAPALLLLGGLAGLGVAARRRKAAAA